MCLCPGNWSSSPGYRTSKPKLQEDQHLKPCFGALGLEPKSTKAWMDSYGTDDLVVFLLKC